MAKLKGAPTKLSKHTKATTEKAASKSPPRKLMQLPKEKAVGGLKRRTFMLHDDDLEWLEQTTKKLKNKSSVWSISKSALVRLGISLLRDQLREKDINEILQRIDIS